MVVAVAVGEQLRLGRGSLTFPFGTVMGQLLVARRYPLG